MPPLTPPPDPNPRTPALRAPRGAVDTHIHPLGPADQYPFDPGRRYRQKAKERRRNRVVGLTM